METSRVKAFNKWLRQSRPGSIYVYFTGSLMHDRGSHIVAEGQNGEDTVVYVPNVEIHAIAGAAWEAMQAGRVHLFQRKLHDDEYEYIAMKRYLAAPLWERDPRDFDVVSG